MPFPTFSAGNVLTASDMNAVGLWLVKTQTIGSAVTTVTISDCFTTNYDDYVVTISDTSTSQDNADMVVQLRTGSTTAATNYYWVYQYVTYSGSVSTFATGNNTNSIGFIARSTNNTITARFDVSQPRLARRTNFRCLTPGGNIAGPMNGFHDVATAYESMIFTLGAGTMSGGTVRVYGYRK